MAKISKNVTFPPGYHVEWSGEYESSKRAQARLAVIVPLTLLVIFIILYTMFQSAKWAALILAVVAMLQSADCWPFHHGHTLQRLVRIGFLALFGVSVQTGVIMLEYINQLRARGTR